MKIKLLGYEIDFIFKKKLEGTSDTLLPLIIIFSVNYNYYINFRFTTVIIFLNIYKVFFKKIFLL